MTREHHPEQVENLALLKFCRPPHRRKRRKLHLVRTVPGPHAQHDRPVLFGHRIQVIDNLEISWLGMFARFLDRLLGGLFHPVHRLRDQARDLHLFGDFLVQVVHAGQIGKKVERQLRVVAKKQRHLNYMDRVQKQRVLARRA
jgi:hypothetical protein